MGTYAPYRYTYGDVVKTNKSTWTVLGRVLKNTKSGTLKKHYLCKCHDCGAVLWKNEQELYQGSLGQKGQGSCGICSNRIVRTGFNDIATTHPETVKFFKNPEDALYISAGSREKRWFKCPHCGYEIEKCVEYVVHKNDMCCSQCGDNISYPNKLALSVLRQLNAENLTVELKESWSENKRYDFSFFKDGVHYLLEMDGGFHFEERFGRKSSDVAERDELKNQLAAKNNCVLIRIECKKSKLDYIKNNMEDSLLAELYDFANIDWSIVEKNCAKSILVELVNYKLGHPDVTEHELAEIFCISRCTVVTYLQRANNIGLITYKTYTEKFNDRYIQAVTFKKQHMEATYAEIGRMLGVCSQTIRNYLLKAEKNGLLELKSPAQIKRGKVKEYIRQHSEMSNTAIGKQLGVSHNFVSRCRKEL